MKTLLARLVRIGLLLLIGITAITCLAAKSVAQPVDITQPVDAGSVVNVEKRPPWTTSRLRGIPDPPPYRTERVFPHLQFANPVVLTKAPGSSRWFVAELAGKIVSFPDDPDCRSPDLFIDLAKQIEGVQHIYGMAFHPDFGRNRFVYICYLAGRGFQGDARVSRFEVTGTSPPECDATSERLLLKWETGGHNGGCLEFGPDGYLYISTGDGASPSPPDPYQAGQNLADLRSSILRIDIDRGEHEQPYRIPEDNPFVDQIGARPEIWAYGLRNPWRMNFDHVTGDLWLGDVGWESWEMVHRIERGGNYGWSVMEGPLPIYPDGRRGPTPISPPIVALPRSVSASVTGGYVYRGTKFPELVGAYIFGDYDTRRVWATRIQAEQNVSTQELAATDLRLITFGQDERNELYLVDYDQGTLHQLVSRGTDPQDEAFPRKLSQTGLFAATSEHLPEAGVVPFSVNVSQWADHATAERWIALPEDAVVSQNPAGKSGTLQQLEFPENSVLVKTLSLETRRGEPTSRRPIETQILHRYAGEWRGYSYRWHEDQSDATLVAADGEQARLSISDPQAPRGQREQLWTFAGRAQCARCHHAGAGYTLAFNLAQLDRPIGSNNSGPSQLQVLEKLGAIRLSSESSAPAASLGTHTWPPSTRRLVDPYDETHNLDQRFRSYLHVNCAHCHQATVGGNSDIDLRAELPLEQTKTLGVLPLQGTFGLVDPQLISLDDPYRSVLAYRLAKTGRGRMPRGSEVVDSAAVELFYQWHAQHHGRNVDASPGLQRLEEENAAAPEHGLNTTNDALRLQHLILTGELSEAARQDAIQAGAHHREAAIAELFEAFVPPEERTRRLPHAVEPNQILALQGDPARGKELFFSTEAVQCQACHRVGVEGGTLGPDLSTIGRQRDRSHLLQSMLEPSREIDPQYLTWVVQTTAGQLHSGFIKSKTDQAIVLRDAQNREFNLPTDHVDALQPLSVSVMPELLLQEMTASEIADLLAYLSSLR